MKKTTIIIPVHEYNDTVEKYLEKCLKSIDNQKDVETPNVLIITSLREPDASKEASKLLDLVSKFNNITTEIKYHENGDSFQQQINEAVNHIKTEFFSILEFDDELSEGYLRNVELYLNNDEFTNIAGLLPMIIEVNSENQPHKMTNDVVWSKQFVGDNGKIGYLNIDALKQFTDFKICGGTFNAEKFKQYGGLKNNIELTFQLELFLRFMNQGGNIFVIPKIIYKHIEMREGGLFFTYLTSIQPEDRKFWFEKALSEYYFTEDRIIEKKNPHLKLIKNESVTA